MTSMNTVVVSGAGSGIGRAVVKRLVADGRHVTAVGRRREPLQRLADESPDSVDAVPADVSTPGGAVAVAEHIGNTGRDCAGVVAAAGGLSPAGGDDLADVGRDWHASFSLNVLTAVLLVEGLRDLLQRAGGRVVAISSVAALRGSGFSRAPYGAMKAALHAWVFDLAKDLGEYGGTANVVAPGFVPDTEFWADRLSDEMRDQRVSQTLVGRHGTPAEVASLIGWLLGPDGGWMTAQVLSPNGGAVLGR